MGCKTPENGVHPWIVFNSHSMNNQMIYIWCIPFVLLVFSCRDDKGELNHTGIVADTIVKVEKVFREIPEDIYVRDYFRWVSACVDSINADRSDSVDEYVLVHANPWIIDSLRHTDYYYLKDLGIISKDPAAIRIIEKGSLLYVPDSLAAAAIRADLENTSLDINIPEFKLRVVRHDSTLLEFPVRVGRNERRYLAMAGGVVDMRTQVGVGKIVRVNRNPVFINPRDNKKYLVTHRDDNIVTKLPNIPWLEPEINGTRYGQLFHPTTNLETLGKAYSNGCIGLRESDSWSLYFFAPLGAKVVIRYDLQITGEDGAIRELPNIYPGFEKRRARWEAAQAAAASISMMDDVPCYCGK